MTLGYAVSLRNAQVDAVKTAIDAGVSAGFIRIYNGVRPATGGAVTTLLAQLTFSDPSFPAASSGAITANAITSDASADNTGTATWFRVVDSAGNHVMDGDVGTSGTDMVLNTTSIVAGGTVSISSFVITCGNP